MCFYYEQGLPQKKSLVGFLCSFILHYGVSAKPLKISFFPYYRRDGKEAGLWNDVNWDKRVIKNKPFLVGGEKMKVTQQKLI